MRLLIYTVYELYSEEFISLSLIILDCVVNVKIVIAKNDI